MRCGLPPIRSSSSPWACSRHAANPCPCSRKPAYPSTRPVARRCQAGKTGKTSVASMQSGEQSFPCFPRLTPPSEGTYPGELAANRELVNGLGAFVGDDALEIECMADRHVFGADSRPAEHVAAIACDVQRHAAVVPLCQ